MYEKFYGLTASPFQLSPDHRFFFESSVHRTALVGRGRQLSVAVSGPTDRAEAKTICEDIRSGVAAAGEPARVVVWVRDPSGTPLATTTSDGRCVT